MTYSKCKDANPKDTVAKIKKIHEKLGLDLKYTYEEKVSGVFSSAVTDNINGWNTCGKGTTHMYCKASGYAESIEHLSSYFAYNVKSVSKEANEYLGFYRYPDEEKRPISMIKNISPHIYQDMINAYTNYSDEVKKEILPETIESIWSKFLCSEETIFVPYYSYNKKDVVLLPELVINNLCGSNGGGAGNTPEEAIGHALDEISERYAKYQIYHNRLTPPTIPREYIKKKSIDLYNLIIRIESLGNYKVVVKDASMGLKFPVLAVLLIDKSNQRYIANFGAHPKFEIALERCLTEMFQLYSASCKSTQRKKMSKWRHFEDKKIDSIKNWVSLLRDDTGIIPDSFFAGNESWEFKEWENYKNYNNTYGMKKQLDNFNLIAEDIYIRSVSYLGFPVYRVYIPNISITHLILNEYQLESFEYGKEMLINNISKVQEWKKQDLEKLKETVFNENSFINSLLLRNMNEAMTNSLEAAILYDVGKCSEAIKILQEQDDNYCNCVLKDFELAKMGKQTKERDQLLKLFFGADEWEYALCWRSDNVFINIVDKYINNCNFNMNGNTSKNILNTDNLHKRIKEIMNNTQINQMDIKKICDKMEGEN